jgi:hypothetical protein
MGGLSAQRVETVTDHDLVIQRQLKFWQEKEGQE